MGVGEKNSKSLSNLCTRFPPFFVLKIDPPVLGEMSYAHFISVFSEIMLNSRARWGVGRGEEVGWIPPCYVEQHTDGALRKADIIQSTHQHFSGS